MHSLASSRELAIGDIPKYPYKQVHQTELHLRGRRASSLVRGLLVPGAGRERERGPPVLEKGVRFTDLWKSPSYADTNTEVVIIIDEPAPSGPQEAPKRHPRCGFVSSDDNLDVVISYRDVDNVRSVDRLPFSSTGGPRSRSRPAPATNSFRTRELARSSSKCVSIY